jgi:predicted DNA-binding transcriptional regulator AlpA
MKDLLNAAAVARRLGRGRSWFYENRADLERIGFPRPIPVVGRWDPARVDEWVARGGRMDKATREHNAKRSLDEVFGLSS